MDVSNNFKQKQDFDSSVYQQLSQQLKNYSRNTLKKDLAMLVEEGLLLETGAGRGVPPFLKRWVCFSQQQTPR